MTTLERMEHAMNKVQGNTPPKWLGRSSWLLCMDVVGGWAQNKEKIIEVFRMLYEIVRPARVRSRLHRLKELGHCDVTPTMSQLLVASRHQLSFSLGADTKEFYRAQGVPWTFHNLRRFFAYPTTMMDPVGLFSPMNSIIQHVLQTFHRHATYDLVLLHGHEGGVEEMQNQLHQLAQGTHPHQRALDSLVEDGSYHDRLRRDVQEFAANPFVPAREIPKGLVNDPYLMLAMDQFKDIRGYTNYASRLQVGPFHVLQAFFHLVVNETIGEAIDVRIGPKNLTVEACEPELVEKHMEAGIA